MNNKTKFLTAAAILGAITISAYYIKDYLTYATTDNAQVAARNLMLSSTIPGNITKVNIKEGDFVKEGAILIEIDSRDIENSLRQYEGELTALFASKSDAEKNLKRISALYKKDAASQQNYDQANAMVKQLNGKYDSLQAVIDQVKLNCDNTKIKAPSDGYIAKTSAEVGQMTASGIPLVGFVDANDRWVVANFKETEIPRIRPGAKVKIEVDAIQGRIFEGEVESLSAATGSTFTLLPPDNASGNFTKVVQRIPVRVKLLNLTQSDKEMLRNGLSAVVKVKKSL